MAGIPLWAIIAFFVFDSIVMIGVLFFVLSKRNKNNGGASNPPGDFTATSEESPFHSSTHAGNSNANNANAHSALNGDEIMDLLQRGQKIEAIKIYRERTNCGLKEAKDAVEELQRQNR